MSKLSPSLRSSLLATLSLTVALSGCVTDGAGTNKSSAAPVVAGGSMEDPMLAAPPSVTEDGNGSQRVPLGQLAANVQPTPAASRTAPGMLVPPPSAGSAIDPMSAPPPSVTSNSVAPPSVASKSVASKSAAPMAASTAPKPAAISAPVVPKAEPAAPMVLSAAPQPETLAKMTKTAPAKAELPKAEAPKVEPAKVDMAQAEPMKVEPPKAAAPKAVPQLAQTPRETYVTTNADQARAMAGPASASAAAPMRLNIPPKGSAPTATSMEQNETIYISGANSVPVRDTREFIPATVTAGGGQMLAMSGMPVQDAPGGMTSRPLSAAEKNIAQRFENLKMLLDQGLITPEEYARHRSANLGALLPYTHEPAAAGLERPVPGGDALVARLEALRRSLEVRAISTKQHAMERSMIISALLPDAPVDRMNAMPAPEDIIQAATMVSHLQTLRARNLVSQDEFDREKRAIEFALKNGVNNPQAAMRAETAPARAAAAVASAAAAKKAEALTKAQAEAAAAAEELTAPVPGPVLHLASFRSQDAAKKAWADALDHNKNLLGQVKPVIRRIDLGPERGVFYRLMAGPYASLSAAETACQALKQNNQFCRASEDGS